MLHRIDSSTVVRWSFWIFVLALLLRVLFVELTTITPVSDSARYLEHAQRLLAGEGYVSRHQMLSAFTPPGYPFFLAAGLWLSGDSIHVIQLMQALLGALCAVLTFLICVRLFDLRIAATAGILLALSPTAIVYSGELLTEVLTTVLLFAFFWLLQGIAAEQQQVKAPLWLVACSAGLLLGAALLVRPAVLAFCVGIGIWWLFWKPVALRRKWLLAVGLALGVIVVVAPWSARNYLVFDRFVPLATNGGYNLMLGNNPQAWGGGWMALEIENELQKMNEVDAEKRARQLAVDWIKAHPVDYAKVSVRRALNWLSVEPDYIPGIRLTSTREVDRDIVAEFGEHRSGQITSDFSALNASKQFNAIILVAWSLLVMPLALVGIALDLGRRAKGFLLLPLATYIGILCLTFMQSRFREIVMPILLMYSAAGFWGIKMLPEIWRQGSLAGRAAMACMGLVLALFALLIIKDRNVIAATMGI